MIIIRRALISDGPTVKNLMVKILKSEGIYSEEYHQKYPHLDLDDIPAAYGSGGFLVAESDNEIIGTIGFFRIDDEFAELRRFYVHPDFRGRGIGQSLLEEVFTLCIKKGFAMVIAVSEIQLKRALKVYDSAGFRIFKSIEDVNYLVRFFNPESEKQFPFSRLSERGWIFDFDGKDWRARI